MLETTMKLKYLLIALVLASTAALTGCPDDATVAKANLTKAADNFELMRRIVFVNTWTDTTLLVIEGKCNIEYGQARTSVICKIGGDQYKRMFIGNSGQTTAIVEQMESVAVNVYHFRRTFKPQTIIPDIDFRGSTDAIVDALTPDSSD
jgi:hypothetical protein